MSSVAAFACADTTTLINRCTDQNWSKQAKHNEAVETSAEAWPGTASATDEKAEEAEPASAADDRAEEAEPASAAGEKAEETEPY